MKSKDKCDHSISYGRIGEHFILSCGKCSHVFRVDDMITQKRVLSDFKLSCECGKETVFEQINKETCKWDPISFPPHTGRKLFNTGCEHILKEKPEYEYSYKYCPYCGKEIEEGGKLDE